MNINYKHFVFKIQHASSHNLLEMASAMIITTTDIVLLMEVTAVDPVSIENSAKNANVKLDTLTKSQMQE